MRFQPNLCSKNGKPTWSQLISKRRWKFRAMATVLVTTKMKQWQDYMQMMSQIKISMTCSILLPRKWSRRNTTNSTLTVQSNLKWLRVTVIKAKTKHTSLQKRLEIWQINLLTLSLNFREITNICHHGSNYSSSLTMIRWNLPTIQIKWQIALKKSEKLLVIPKNRVFWVEMQDCAIWSLFTRALVKFKNLVFDQWPLRREVSSFQHR